MILNARPFLLLFLLVCLACPLGVQAEGATVLLVEITDTINQASVEIVQASLNEAAARDAEAVILLLDTPGGGLQETFDIADMIQASEIPVVGFVYPDGSTAWSAGTFILMSTHVAAMASHTVIGSAQPVEISFEGTRLVNDSKTINALVEWIQVRAEIHGRNQTIAAQFISRNLNLNASTALEVGAIEIVADTMNQLLASLDGRNVTTAAGEMTLHTAYVDQDQYTPSVQVQILKIISNPVLTSLLLMLGIFALIFGISSPGYGAEVFGVIAILLSLIGSGFGLSTVSIIFIIIGCLLLIIEIFAIPGFGVIGIGGAICLVIGSIFLVPSYAPPTSEWVIRTEWINNVILIIVVSAILIAAFFLFLLYKVLQIRKKKTAMGTFKGETARTIDRITPDTPGYVRFKGEYWKARADTIIEPNSQVLIVGRDEATLIVTPKYKESKD